MQTENERLKQQIESGAMAQPIEEESVKGLTAKGINLLTLYRARVAKYQSLLKDTKFPQKSIERCKKPW